MDSIYSKDYATFMEETLKGMIELPVEGICVVTKLKGGAMFANFFNSTMVDKIAYAGIIQQDAMLDLLKANNYIDNDKE